jgi:inosine/xanthosine triphosphatase
MKVVVGSINPVKLNAARRAFGEYFSNAEVAGYEVESGVPGQPLAAETFEGAANRALALAKGHTADFYVGIEGGVLKQGERWFQANVCCILDAQGRKGYGTSANFELPRGVEDELFSGKELGDVIDLIVGERNTKQKGGAIGYFTKGVITREALVYQSIIAALIPFINTEYGQAFYNGGKCQTKCQL